MYVPNLDTVAKYGWIEKKVTWNDVNTPEYLLRVAKEYLKLIQFDEMELELSAVDLHYFNVDYESIDLLDNVRTISEPHGLDRTFPVKKMKIPLNKPESTKFTLGDKVATSLTTINSNINQEVYDKINKIPSTSGILKKAQDNATSLINMAGKSGNVVIRNNEILIMDEPDIDKAQNIWRWNVNGFGHSSNGYQGPFNTAITMDGTVMGEYIAAGSISAEKLTVEATKTMERMATEYVDGQLSKYYTAVTVDSMLKTLADSITLEVTSRTLPNENLLKTSRNPITYDDLVRAPGTTTSFNSYFQEYVFTSKCANNTIGTNVYTSRFPVESGKNYTFSCDYKNFVKDARLMVELCWRKTRSAADDAYDGTIPKSVPIEYVGDIQRCSCTFTIPSGALSAFIRCYIYTVGENASANCYLNKLKVEVGNAATPWEMNKTDIISRATLKVMDDKITSKVSNKDFGTYVEQNATSIRIAWNTISSYISIEAGGVVAYRNNSKTENNVSAKLMDRGLELWRTGTNVGYIGSNEWKSDNSKKGLVFDLEYWGYFMSWGAQDSTTDNTYYVRMLYAHGGFDDYIQARLYFSAPAHFTKLCVFESNTYVKDGYSYYKGLSGSDYIYLPASPPESGSYYEARVSSGLIVNTYSNDSEVEKAR